MFVAVVPMTEFKKVECPQLALWAKHPWQGSDGKGVMDSPC